MRRLPESAANTTALFYWVLGDGGGDEPGSSSGGLRCSKKDLGLKLEDWFGLCWP